MEGKMDSGPSRQFVAEYAIDVVSALEVRPPETVRRNLRWLNVDSNSYLATFEFEDAIDRWGLPQDLSNDERDTANSDLSEWHSALPFSDAERRLILNKDAIANCPWMLRRMIGKVTIIEDGQDKVASGRELMQRWWKWRRGTDQFEGTNGVDRGRQALHRFAERLLLPDRLPPLDD